MGARPRLLDPPWGDLGTGSTCEEEQGQGAGLSSGQVR